MDKYQRVEKPRPEVPIMDNEIRIATQGTPRNYVTYALTLLRERGASEVVLRAMGKAIDKAVTIAEIIKRRIPDLHQNTTTSSAPITYIWEPVEESLLPLETTRHVSIITITLSARHLDRSSACYQPPLPADQVNSLPPRTQEHGRGRSSDNAQYGNGSFNHNNMGTMDVGPRGRGDHGRNRFGYDGRGRGGQGRIGGNDQDGVEVASRGRGRGRGRARGRSGRN